MTPALLDHIQAFRGLLAPSAPGCPDARRYTGGQHDLRVVFGSMVHGDEVGSLPGLLAVMRALAAGTLSFGGVADFFVGNAAAALRGQRQLEADLNRVFVFDEDGRPRSDTLEGRRAAELAPLLTGCTLFIDLHQTAQPTARPFFTLPWRPREAAWIRALHHGDEAWITRAPGERFSAGTCCADEFVRDQGLAAITLELGVLGFTDAAADRTAALVRRALALLDRLAEAGDAALIAAAAARPAVEGFAYVHAEPYRDRAQRLRSGLVNFQPVTAGEVLGTPDLRAPRAGRLMFPKYPPEDAPLPGEIFRLVAPLDDTPERLWGHLLPPLGG